MMFDTETEEPRVDGGELGPRDEVGSDDRLSDAVRNRIARVRAGGDDEREDDAAEDTDTEAENGEDDGDGNDDDAGEGQDANPAAPV